MTPTLTPEQAKALLSYMGGFPLSNKQWNDYYEGLVTLQRIARQKSKGKAKR